MANHLETEIEREMTPDTGDLDWYPSYLDWDFVITFLSGENIIPIKIGHQGHQATSVKFLSDQYSLI